MREIFGRQKLLVVSPAEKLLVLDLDETLIHARDEALDRSPDFRVGPHLVYERPGLLRFISGVLARFQVGIWTSSGETYAESVVRRIFDGHRPAFVYARDRCTMRRDLETQTTVWLKDIRKLARLGYPKERIVFVDDSPEKLVRSYGNLVRVTPFEGDPADRELDALLSYLEREIAPAFDVRAIEKRGWRARYVGPDSPR